SMGCVRPDFTAVRYSSAWRVSAFCRCLRAGIRSLGTAPVAAMWIDDGNTALDDWEAFTWSLGWTGRPSRSCASVATTSLAFMLDEVPDPVWNTSSGDWSSHLPSATSRAASAIAAARSLSSTPSSAFTVAEAALTWPSAAMCAASSVRPEIGKFSTAPCVCARHFAAAGTRTSPMESCSTRNSRSPMARHLRLEPVRRLSWQPLRWLPHSRAERSGTKVTPGGGPGSLLVDGVVLAFPGFADGFLLAVHPDVAGGRVVDHGVDARLVVLPRLVGLQRLVAEHRYHVARDRHEDLAVVVAGPDDQGAGVDAGRDLRVAAGGTGRRLGRGGAGALPHHADDERGGADAAGGHGRADERDHGHQAVARRRLAPPGPGTRHRPLQAVDGAGVAEAPRRVLLQQAGDHGREGAGVLRDRGRLVGQRAQRRHHVLALERGMALQRGVQGRAQRPEVGPGGRLLACGHLGGDVGG